MRGSPAARAVSWQRTLLLLLELWRVAAAPNPEVVLHAGVHVHVGAHVVHGNETYDTFPVESTPKDLGIAPTADSRRLWNL